jgi:hypothetical protein
MVDLQIYKSAGMIPAKATQHLKAHLGTRFLIENKKREKRNKKAKVHGTNTNSFSLNGDKLHLDVR